MDKENDGYPTMTTISIVTPCYNAGRYIEETIRSVLYQEGDFKIDYIIIDGGSTDETLAIIRKYKDLMESRRCCLRCNDVRLDFISERDEGMYDALGKGFERTTGDIIAYINADDYYLPHAFSTVVEIFDKFPEVDWLTGMNMGYNEKGQITSCCPSPNGQDGAASMVQCSHIHQETQRRNCSIPN
jgi:glycosyltransferase involved in cell wall biosynthesis